jgi:hypothetical protein
MKKKLRIKILKQKRKKARKSGYLMEVKLY